MLFELKPCYSNLDTNKFLSLAFYVYRLFFPSFDSSPDISNHPTQISFITIDVDSCLQ